MAFEIPYVRGKVAAQAHVGLPEGTVEEEYARNGFFGRYAHLYRKHAPVGWTRIEGPLRPRAFSPAKLEVAGGAGDYLARRVALLGNQDARISLARLSEPMPYGFRNADADELLFVHDGAGRIETDFGHMGYEKGDYLLIPRGTLFRLAPSSLSTLLVVESSEELNVPERGLLGQHALFDPAVVGVPTPGEGSTIAPNAAGEYEIRILRQGEVTSVFYPHEPFDVVGYKGTLVPMKLNVRDIRPVLSERYHLPPSAHATFATNDVIVCTFLPRGLETGDETALRVPFYHSNIDFDEVLFYHEGDFFSREGIEPAMLTFHPQGIHHGPQPNAVKRSQDKTRTDEIAVMVDTRRPLNVLDSASRCERADYWKSWQER